MQRLRGGARVNMCSLASHSGEVFPAYGSSTPALTGLTKIAATEFTDWQTLSNSVSSSAEETELNAGQPFLRPMPDMNLMHRRGRTEEVASAVQFLASDDARLVTGQDRSADGGFTSGTGAKFAHAMAKRARLVS